MSSGAVRPERFTIISDDGVPFDAHFEVDSTDMQVAIILHSRGGTIAAGNARNVDYLVGLETMLSRLRAADATIVDAYVDSSEAVDLPVDARRLQMRGFPYPVDLGSVSDVSLLRREMTRAQTTAGRHPGTAPRGGNPTKRIRIVLGGPPPDPAVVAASVGGTAAMPRAQTLPPVTTAAPRGRVGGQGYERDKAVREAIEAHAMAEAATYLVANGWECLNTAATHPYDYFCTRDGEQMIVEVKGTRSEGRTVHVTAGEIREARRWAPASALYVHANIRISREPDGAILATGGRGLWYFAWSPADDHLAATDFSYMVPSAAPRELDRLSEQ